VQTYCSWEEVPCAAQGCSNATECLMFPKHCADNSSGEWLKAQSGATSTATPTTALQRPTLCKQQPTVSPSIVFCAATCFLFWLRQCPPNSSSCGSHKTPRACCGRGNNVSLALSTCEKKKNKVLNVAKQGTVCTAQHMLEKYRIAELTAASHCAGCSGKKGQSS
jgi:hypothetical protein